MHDKNFPYLESIFTSIIKDNGYDKDIEIFWYGFKESVINFIKNREKIKEDVFQKLDNDSTHLNLLKANSHYDDIINHVSNRIKEYVCLVIIYNAEYYHANILLTNIKRWHSILSLYKKDELVLDDNYITYINAYTKIVKKNNNNEFHDYFANISISEIKSGEKIHNLLDLAIKYKINSAIESISSKHDISAHIKNKYNINVHRNTKANKILSLIKNS